MKVNGVNMESVNKDVCVINFEQMIEKSPINIMLADPSGTLTYMNSQSMETLKTLEQYLPDRVENLVGKSIDWFHKNPDYQKKIISNPDNLPKKAVINVGPEKLDLLVTPIVGKNGEYLGPMVSWSIVTDKIRIQEEMARMMEMVEKSPINTMLATPE